MLQETERHWQHWQEQEAEDSWATHREEQWTEQDWETPREEQWREQDWEAPREEQWREQDWETPREEQWTEAHWENHRPEDAWALGIEKEEQEELVEENNISKIDRIETGSFARLLQENDVPAEPWEP